MGRNGRDDRKKRNAAQSGKRTGDKGNGRPVGLLCWGWFRLAASDRLTAVWRKPCGLLLLGVASPYGE